MEIHDFLLKEACYRIDKKFEIDNFFLNDSVAHLASVQKKAFPINRGASQFSYASNIEYKSFPYDDKKRISDIKKNIAEKFTPLLVQRFKTSQGIASIDLRDIMGDPGDPKSPFYIRLQFKKHLLPPESEEAILTEAENIDPILKEFIEFLSDSDLDINCLPYYHRDPERSGQVNKKSGLIALTEKMLSSFSGNPNQFPIEDYWQDLDQSLQEAKWPKLVGQQDMLRYTRAAMRTSDEIDQMRKKKDLLWAIHYAENPPVKLYEQVGPTPVYRIWDASPQVMEEKKAELKDFLINEWKEKALTISQGEKAQNDDVDYASLAQRKALESLERIWEVFSIDPSKRNISTGKILAKRGLIGPPYDKLSKNDLRSVLKFLKVPFLRFHAKPRLYPNGFDLNTIYPPLEYDSEQGIYNLDFANTNLGFKDMKSNSDSILEISDKHEEFINDLFVNLNLNQHIPDDIRDFLKTHTGADNLLFLVRDLPKMAQPQSVSALLNESKTSSIYQKLHKLISGTGMGKGIADSFGDTIASWIVQYLDAKYAKKDKKKLKEKEQFFESSNPGKDFWQKDKEEIWAYAQKLSELYQKNPEMAALSAQMLVQQPVGDEANQKVFENAEQIYNLYKSGNGHKFAKIMDLIHYLVLKHTDDPVYRVKGKNYSSGAVSGEILLGIEYATRVNKKDIFGEEQELAEAVEDPAMGTSPEMLGKSPYAVHLTEEAPTVVPKKPQKDHTYSGHKFVKLIPNISYTVLQTSKKAGGMLRSTQYKQKEMELGEKGLGGEKQETGYISSNVFDTLEEAVDKLTDLYSGAKDFLGDQLEMITQRMDLATKRIRESIETAIQIYQPQIEQQTGVKIKSETGQDIEESLGELKEEIVSLEESTIENMTGKEIEKEEVEEETKIPSTMPSVFYNLALRFNKETGLWEHSDKAQKIAEELMYHDDGHHAATQLLDEGYTGDYLALLVEKLNLTIPALIDAVWDDYLPDLKDFLEVYKPVSFQNFLETYETPKETVIPSPEINETIEEDMTKNKDEINKQSSLLDRLIKIANNFDRKGQIDLVNKIDLLIAKLGEK